MLHSLMPYKLDGHTLLTGYAQLQWPCTILRSFGNSIIIFFLYHFNDLFLFLFYFSAKKLYDRDATEMKRHTHTKKESKESAFKTYKNNFPLLLFHLMRITLLFYYYYYFYLFLGHFSY